MEEQTVRKWLQENSEVPEFRNYSIKDVKSGESNHNFIICADNEKYVLRVSREISRENRLENEAEKLEFLEQQGIENVPRKIFFRKNTDLGAILLETFVGEEDLNSEKMNEKRLRSLAQKVAEIHSIPVEKCSDFFGTEKKEVNLKEIYQNDFEKWSKRPFNEYRELTDNVDQRIKKYFEKQKQLLRKIPDLKVEKGLVHGDLGFNIRASGNCVSIVDWEFSRVDYPENEILYCFEHEDLNSEQRETFLVEYQKHRELEEDFEQTRKFYSKFLAFNDMIWAAKRVEKGEEKHQDLLEERLEYLEKLYQED